MHKIISVFQRNYDGDRLIRNEVVPGAEWVLAGEGIATRKYDGSCCMVSNGELFKRYDSKKGKKTPVGFIPAQDPDPITGHWPGWMKVGDGTEDKWFREAWKNLGFVPPDGTYEAIGPHFQGNPECGNCDSLIRHGVTEMVDCPRDFEGIRDYLLRADVEGIVFHHKDGRMAKVKKRDYGLKRIPEHRLD
jgi:hypothetical protein